MTRARQNLALCYFVSNLTSHNTLNLRRDNHERSGNIDDMRCAGKKGAGDNIFGLDTLANSHQHLSRMEQATFNASHRTSNHRWSSCRNVERHKTPFSATGSNSSHYSTTNAL